MKLLIRFILLLSCATSLPVLANHHEEGEMKETPTAERAMVLEVEAQITGNVWKVEKSVGDEVQEEDVLLIIESMKMEIPVEAPSAGRISEIRVAEGDSIDEGDVVVVLD